MLGFLLENCNDQGLLHNINTIVKEKRCHVFSSSLIPALHTTVMQRYEAFHFNGIIINAGGYTHTSVAILDALLAVKKPTIELHITNIYKREDFRHKSLISKAADGIICGMGSDGYIMALNGMKKILNNENR